MDPVDAFGIGAVILWIVGWLTTIWAGIVAFVSGAATVGGIAALLAIFGLGGDGGGGCHNTADCTLQVQFDPAPAVVEPGKTISVYAVTSGGTSPLSFGWDWSGPEGMGYGDGPTFTVTPPEWSVGPVVDYKVHVTVTDANGCVATAEKLVTVGSPATPPTS